MDEKVKNGSMVQNGCKTTLCIFMVVHRYRVTNFLSHNELPYLVTGTFFKGGKFFLYSDRLHSLHKY